MADFNVQPDPGFRLIKVKQADGTLKITRVPADKLPDQTRDTPKPKGS